MDFMKPSYDYLLLGGGTSCGYAARGIRQLDNSGSIVIISADTEPPYDRPPFSKGFLKNDAMDVSDAHSNEDSFYSENDIDVALNKRAKSIDLAGKKVTLDSGEEVGYGKLLYALGSEPKRLDYAGSENAWTLRTASDSQRIKDAAKEGTRAVIVGGGYIGTEVAASLASRGVNVTVLEAGPKLGRFFPDSMSRAIESQLESMGVAVVTNDSITAFENGTVTTKAGKRIAADFLVEGVGVAPRAQLGKQAGLKPAADGLFADANLRSSDSSVWLAGDVAVYDDETVGHEFRAEHHMHAQWTGEHAGRAMAGDASPYRKVPYFFSDIGPLSMILRGDPGAEGRTFEFGNEADPRLTEVVVSDDGRLAKVTDLRKDWSEQEPLVDLAERIIDGKVPVEPLVEAMKSPAFDPSRLGELLT
jgi:NADPH-dependent 2,4-dienoyl-CoA reductase/sulfur reductase-like enzyme